MYTTELIQSYGSDLPGLRKSLKVYYYAFGDKKNVELRRRMLTGDISAKALLEMPESVWLITPIILLKHFKFL